MSKWSGVVLVSLCLAAQAHAAPPPGCTSDHVMRCGARGGSVESDGGRCVCRITTYTPRRVTNAQKGDVGLVPVHDNRGEETVGAVMAALVQNHRHAVIFRSESSIVHNTSYDDMKAAVQELRLRLDPAVLMNGAPGVERRSVESAYLEQRLNTEGLLLKPKYEFLRQMFESAADEAEADIGSAWYKISDYTSNVAMGYGISSDRSRDRRGTMCSGTVYDAFTRAGFTITRHTYPASLRQSVARAAYDSVFDQVPNWSSVFSMRSRVANQVVNCFAAFGRTNGGVSCDDTSNTWESGVGSGTTVAPDNLLPVQFTLTSSGAFSDEGDAGYTWQRLLSSSSMFRMVERRQVTAGDSVQNSQRCSGSTCTSFGASTTPFQKIELQNMVGGVYESVVLDTF